jgi:hypothetical protein
MAFDFDRFSTFKASTNTSNIYTQGYSFYTSFPKMSTPFAKRASRNGAHTPSPRTPRHDSGTYQMSGSDMLEEEYADTEEVTDKNGVSKSRMLYFERYPGDECGRVDLSCYGLEDVPCTTPRRDLNSQSDPRNGSSSSLNTRQQLLLDGMRGDRKPIISVTLHADKSYSSEPTDNAEAVRELLIRPLVLAKDTNLGKTASVYAFRDVDLDLVKIGFAADVEKRRKALEKKCKIIGGLTLVASIEEVLAYRRLEKLIQQDLAPHRWFFGCHCGTSSSKGYTKHQEYFDVSDEVAQHTIKFWGDFVKQYPWGKNPNEASEPRSSVSVKLRSNWFDLLATTDLHRPSKYEEHGDHDKRLQRWRDVLKMGDLKLAEPQEGLSSEDLTPTPPGENIRSSLFSQDSKPSLFSQDSKPGLFSQDSKPSLFSQDSKPGLFSQDSKPGLFSQDSKPGLFSQDSKPGLFSQDSKPGLFSQDSKPGLFSQDSKPGLFSQDSKPGLFSQDSKAIFSCDAIESSLLSEDVKPDPRGKSTLQFQFGISPSASNDGDSKAPSSGGTKSSSTPEPRHDSSKQGSHRKSSEKLTTPTEIKAPRSEPEVRLGNFALRSDYQVVGDIKHGSTNRSTSDLLMRMLANEARPLPARTISADLFQLRWPLACLVAFVLHSPFNPPALSFVMWSVFLPFFVAELRGWELAEKTMDPHFQKDLHSA